jgi:hypothetical protein
MFSGYDQCRCFASCHVAFGLLQELVSTSQFVWRVTELLH